MDSIEVTLDFAPRDYQRIFYDAYKFGKYKKIIAVLPRRSGKDLSCFNFMIERATERIGVYFYCLPTFSQARKVMWDNLTIEGKRILSYIPDVIIANKNVQEMKVRLLNGSLIQFIGSDTYDTSLVGTNPCGIVFSEASRMDMNAYQFSRPIIAANDGWIIFNTTPYGKNSFYDLFMLAQHWQDEWFVYRMGVDKTRHLSDEVLERERQQMSEDLFNQEYMCSFEMGIEGCFYGKIIDNLRLQSQIGQVPWNPSLPVHTCWDLGVARNMAVILFQKTKTGAIHIIDYLQLKDGGLVQYIHELRTKPYTYGKHIAPHDIRTRDIGSGMSRWGIAYDLGITFIQSKDVPVLDGIERVKVELPKMYIDEKRCSHLIKSLESYRQEWDPVKERYRNTPVADWAAHAADAARYLCLNLNVIDESNRGAIQEALKKKRAQDILRDYE